MSQVRVKDNIYCHSDGEQISIRYVHEPILCINTDGELSESELVVIAKKLMNICDSCEPIASIIKKYEKAYEENPNNDGFVYTSK